MSVSGRDYRTTRRSNRSRPLPAAVLLVALVGSAGCNLDEIIQVEPPDRVTEDVLNDAAQAQLLVASAQGTFECAYGGYALAAALTSGEFNSLGNTTAFSYDRRDPQPAGGFVGIYANGDCAVTPAVNSTPGVYPPLSSARWFADETVRRLEGWTDEQVPNRQSLIATAAMYAGYSMLLLGESMCSIALDAGPELESPAVFALAEERFNKAITAAEASGNTEIENASYVGRARTRLNLGKTAEALADAQQVPVNFVKLALRASDPTNGVTNNQIFISGNQTGQSGVGPNYWDVRWEGTPDPRVPVVDRGITTLGVRRVDQLLYPTDAAPIPLATWEEAQLIIAEIQGGQAAVDIINALHTKYGLPPFAGGDAATILAQIIEERRRQFFLTGHRFYDIRRYNLPLDPPEGSPYRWGGVHGGARCFPIPDNERDANDNF